MTAPACDEPSACPICAGACARLGAVVHREPTLVAGVPIDLSSLDQVMVRCASCGLMFKHPFAPERDLLACYAAASGDHWERDPDPLARRFDDIERVVHAHAKGPRVLDIGCASGALLGYMGQSWERSGIEPGAEAARAARERGVDILGATIDALGDDRAFDVILAIDVLEHLTDPGAFVARVRRALAPGGVLVALTGDTGAPSWRWHGTSYWYAALPEHQVFFSRATLEHLAREHGMTPAHFERTSHARYKTTRVVRDALRGSLWGLVRRARLTRGAAPGWLPARDHMLFALVCDD